MIKRLLWVCLVSTSIGAAADTPPTSRSGKSLDQPQESPLAWVVAGNRVVAATTALTSLTIAPGGMLSAPANKSLSLTVNGIGTEIQAGSYAGNVVLSVTDDIPVKYHDLDPHHYRAALYVNDGSVDASRSVTAAIARGTIGNSHADGIVITSNEPRFNGIVVTGNSKYVVESPVIHMTGNGGNDFAGFGAAIMSSGTADVTVNNARIVNRGAVRTAVFVGGHSVMHVNNSSIETYNGTLPTDYKFTIDVGRMMEVPWMLGLSGNLRATNLVDHGTVYYNNSHIRTQGWGALSTDDAAVVRMYVRNCLIETVESGYGAYSIGDSVDHFSQSLLNVADVGLIMAGPGSGTFTDGTVVNSKRFGVMMHAGMGGGLLTIDKGSVLNTRSTAIQIKGRGGNIIVDNAQLNAGNGILLQAMLNDDPFMPGPGGPGGPGSAGGPPVGVAAPAGGPPAPGPDETPEVKATFRDVTLRGDIINARTTQGEMTLKLEHASITGAITTGTTAPISGVAPTQATYKLIGEVVNTYAPTHDAHGLSISMDARSEWIVTRSSYLTGLTLVKGAVITAPAGKRVTLEVNGKMKPAKPGHYAGAVSVVVH